jgi:hypothetical protein
MARRPNWWQQHNDKKTLETQAQDQSNITTDGLSRHSATGNRRD